MATKLTSTLPKSGHIPIIPNPNQTKTIGHVPMAISFGFKVWPGKLLVRPCKILWVTHQPMVFPTFPKVFQDDPDASSEQQWPGNTQLLTSVAAVEHRHAVRCGDCLDDSGLAPVEETSTK